MVEEMPVCVGRRSLLLPSVLPTKEGLPVAAVVIVLFDYNLAQAMVGRRRRRMRSTRLRESAGLFDKYGDFPSPDGQKEE